MKIAVADDLHCEFGEIILKNTEDADILILAGDVVVFNMLDNSFYQDQMKLFFDFISCEFSRIIYIPGNHEYYNSEMISSFQKFKEFLNQWRNIYFFNNDVLEIDDVRFICSTLWSDLGGTEDHTIWATIKYLMNDYRLIKYGDSLLFPEDTVGFFKNSKKFIAENLSGTKTNVVVTHHAPSKRSIGPRYGDDLINVAYYSDLDQFILDNDIKLWVHGHTHHPVDYMIGNTRVFSNPRGYVGHDELARNFTLKYLEI